MNLTNRKDPPITSTPELTQILVIEHSLDNSYGFVLRHLGDEVTCSGFLAPVDEPLDLLDRAIDALVNGEVPLNLRDALRAMLTYIADRGKRVRINGNLYVWHDIEPSFADCQDWMNV